MLDAMAPIAEAHGASLAQVAIAWLLHQPVVSTVIIGAKRPDQLADNHAANEIARSDAELAALDMVSRLAEEYPHWMPQFQNQYRSVARSPRGASSV